MSQGKSLTLEKLIKDGWRPRMHQIVVVRQGLGLYRIANKSEIMEPSDETSFRFDLPKSDSADPDPHVVFVATPDLSWLSDFSKTTEMQVGLREHRF